MCARVTFIFVNRCKLDFVYIKGVLQVLQRVKCVVEGCDPASGDECSSSVIYCAWRFADLDLLEKM